MTRAIVISAALFLLTLGVFSQVRTFDFVNYDDNIFITQNPYVQEGLTKKGVLWAFTTPYTGTAVMPLAWLSHMLDITLYGLSPGGHHITNLLIHALNTVLLFMVLNLMTGAPWVSAFTAALLSVHPLQAEPVAWISERKGLLCAFFWLSTMLSYVYYARRPSVLRYLPVICCFIAALLAKPIAITLPVALLLVDYWPLNRKIDKNILIEKVLLFLLSGAIGLYTYQVQRAWNVDAFFNVIPLTQRVANVFISYVMYLYHTLVPLSLSPIYVFQDSFSALQGKLSFIAVICISAASIVLIRRMPYFFTGWFWYLVVLSPVAGLAQVGYQSMADRYMYLPLIGLSIAVATGASEGLKHLAARKIILSVGAAIILITSAYLTVRQTAFWRDDISLFNRAASVTKNNFIAYFNLGSAYLSLADYDQALRCYNKAIEIKPSYERAYVNAGFVLLNKNMPREASQYFARASELDPADPAAYFGLGQALIAVGSNAQAVEYFRKALAVDPNYAPAKEFVR
ncbi:MAG: tetratricopeptide repeat protein [Nitrospirae bacterium]|nr:tetratricopeptide repeat protein [Nitrospirota bacterium]